MDPEDQPVKAIVILVQEAEMDKIEEIQPDTRRPD